MKLRKPVNLTRRKLTAREQVLAEEIIRAWVDPGINPQYHERTKDRVRANMPILAHHLDALEKARNTGRRS